MKKVFCCSGYTVSNKEYLELIGHEDWYLPSNSMEILPIGTIINVIDKKSGMSMQLRIIGHWYDYENDTLDFNVDIDGGEMSPQEFIEYMKRCWLTKI